MVLRVPYRIPYTRTGTLIATERSGFTQSLASDAILIALSWILEFNLLQLGARI